METERVYNMVMFRNNASTDSAHKKFLSVGRNTGNMVFTKALEKNMRVDTMPYEKFMKTPWFYDLYDAVLTTDLIWITPSGNFDYLQEQMTQIQKPFVPISVGVQNRLDSIDYNLNASVLRVLNMMQERAVLGVRGEITADILNRNGIKNIEIVGCPSLYYWNHPNFKIKREPVTPKFDKILYNFRSFYGKLSKDEAHFLSYCAQKKFEFIEQTESVLTPQMCPSLEYYSYIGTKLEERKHTFFDINDWADFVSSYDFSFGARFHGNVISLWYEKPALFIVIDSRMKELLDYFNLPYIYMRDFDETRPIEYYYELADYSTFNSRFRLKYNKYLEFLKRNKILL